MVGIVQKIAGNCWLIEIGSSERVQLSIFQVNTDELANRRKLDEDLYEMKNIFNIDDVISCEVQRLSVGLVYYVSFHVISGQWYGDAADAHHQVWSSVEWDFGEREAHIDVTSEQAHSRSCLWRAHDFGVQWYGRIRHRYHIQVSSGSLPPRRLWPQSTRRRLSTTSARCVL